MISRLLSTTSLGIRFLLLLLLLPAGVPVGLSNSNSAAAQAGTVPIRLELLNGLRVMLWPRSNDAKVLIKLRVNSGAAFDLAGKSGQMALLGDMLFPDPEAREFFTEDLGGQLDVSTDYDAIEVTMTGRAAEFERMVSLLRTAVINTQLTDENLTRLREARTTVVRELGVAPQTIADRAIALRLFGDYPYGRAASGATDSLARIDRPDLMLARERFLAPDNSVMVVIGGVDERRVRRATSQLLGPWRKSDKRVPATFRQPEEPDTRTLIVDLPGTQTTEIRLATRGLARADKDYPAATLLALLARDRWQAQMPQLAKTAFFVRHEAHFLPGMFVLGASVQASEEATAFDAARKVLRALAEAKASDAEFARVQSEAAATLAQQTEQPGTLAGLWLDAELYNLPSITEQLNALNKLTPADVQRVAARLFLNAPVVTVAAGNAAQLKSELERAGYKLEVLGEAMTNAPAAPPSKAP